jgi:hypothetical protein
MASFGVDHSVPSWSEILMSANQPATFGDNALGDAHFEDQTLPDCYRMSLPLNDDILGAFTSMNNPQTSTDGQGARWGMDYGFHP